MNKINKIIIVIILAATTGLVLIRKSYFKFYDKSVETKIQVNNNEGSVNPIEPALSLSKGFDKPQEEQPKPTILEKIKEIIIPEPDPNEPPDKLTLDVPFTPQAPFAEWDDRRQQDGCEEASLTMAWYWIQGKSLSKQKAKKEILAINSFSEKLLGESIDTSAEDTMKIFKEYYNYNNIEIKYDINIQDIKNELIAGNIVLMPTDGTILKNPYYVQPGPTRHMLVITGFDDKKSQFITNDPGTKRGEDFKYDYQVIMNAIINYDTGDHAPLIDERKVMIIVKR